MGAKIKPSRVRFNSMPNFRVVGAGKATPDNEKKLPLLYRSSRPDLLTEDEVQQFDELGIRCMLDFRSVNEYTKANGNKLLDHHYPVYKVKTSFLTNPKPGQPVNYSAIPPKYDISDVANSNGTENASHFLLDFFKANYIWAVYNRAPIWFRIYALLYVILDLIMRTEFRYFVRAFAKKVLNKEGLFGQYKDMINHSQAALCSALKLLCNPDNVPAMINCAHGKDRTGIMSALILSCLGRSKEEIAADYAMSAIELEPMKDRLRAEIVEKFHMCPSFTTAKYDTMMEVLDYIDSTWGTVANYLEFIGFGLAEQEQLKNNLLSY